jgi:hypothetical protein
MRKCQPLSQFILERGMAVLLPDWGTNPGSFFRLFSSTPPLCHSGFIFDERYIGNLGQNCFLNNEYLLHLILS